MKSTVYLRLIALFILIGAGRDLKAQTSPQNIQPPGISNPWTEKQLVEPAVLASMINSGRTDGVLIFNIGAVEDIKEAIHIGPLSKKENLEIFEVRLKKVPHSTGIVIYCGCCPFEKCPNVRPAFVMLQKLGFTNIKVLDLPANLKKNWIEKGYPMALKTTTN